MNYCYGWIPDYKDFRDYHTEHKEIVAIMQPNKAITNKAISSKVDLRQYCSPIADQGQLGSCTAHAGCGLVEFYEQKSFKKHIGASRLFLYRTTRNFMKSTGDSGATLRATLGSIVLFGIPPEKYHPYTDDPKKFDIEPSPFLYSFAQNFKALKYYKFDLPNMSTSTLLASLKISLVKGSPMIFGFTVYSSINQADTTGMIPFPTQNETIEGGHAIGIYGFDDSIKISNKNGGQETTGAFIIRNSWGSGWGDRGYGFLPYEYILQGIASDFWAITKKSWIDTGAFD